MTKAPKREKHGRHKEDHKRRTLAARKQRIVRRSHSNHANTHQEVKRPGETRPQLPPAVSQFQGQRTGKVPFGKGDRVLLVGEGKCQDGSVVSYVACKVFDVLETLYLTAPLCPEYLAKVYGVCQGTSLSPFLWPSITQYRRFWLRRWIRNK